MTPRGQHPALETLIQLVRGVLSPGEATELWNHVSTCARCQKEVSTVDTLERAGDVARWTTPSAAKLRSAIAQAQEPIPPVIDPAMQEVVSWTPADVRGEDVALGEGGRTVTRAVEEAEVAVAMFPPDGAGLRRVQGRVWLAEPSPERIEVLLVSGDHVLDRTLVTDGASFTFEVLEPEWVLEVHLPGGRAVVIEGPPV